MTAFTKSRRMIALLVAILMICAPILSMPVQTFAAAAASYFVDGTNGNDNNNGSLAAPFKTIQKAATVATSGDTVEIRTGIYRETVTPASDNVTFKNYGGEKVIMSGGDLVAGWTETADAGIFEANVSWNFDSGNGNIAFFTDSTGNPVSMSPARFPYIKDSELLVKSKYGKFVSATNVDVDPSGTVNADGQFLTYDNEYVRRFTGMTTNAWTGALVYASSNNGFSAQTGEVLSNTADKITFKWPLSGYTPKSFGVASGMYLSNSYQALKLIAGAATKPSNAAVWYKDVATGKLYVYFTDASASVINPSSGQVEFKNRENVFDLEGLSNITIQGINIRSAGVNFKNSHDNTFKGAVIEKVDSYNKLFTMSVLTDGLTKSFELDGYNNTVRDCEIKDMYGYGIKMLGHDNKVINNNIHDVDLFGYYQDGVGIYGYNQLVSHNEIYNVGRAAIGGKFQNSVIQYNKMHDTMKISYDGGIIYLVNHDFDGSEIHHNILYDVPNSANVEGIYPDNVSGNLKVYDNIIYNTKVAMLFNTPNERMTILNNTIHNSKDNSFSSWGDTNDQLETFGTVIIGNIFGGAFASQSANGAVEQYNTTGANAVIGAIFVDPANGDFRLKTPEQYRSIEIPGVTDGHTTGFAVQGAVQPGAVWTAGYDMANASNINPTFQLKKLPYQQLLKNGGFVDGLANWTTIGSPSIITHNAWDFRNGGQKAQGMLIKDGYTGAVLKNNEQISQTVTVKPNTKYTASLWGKVMGERRYYSDAIPVTPATAPDSFSFRNSEGAFISGSSVTLKFPDVEFATGVDKVMFGTASENSTGKIEMYKGDPAAGGVLMASQTLGSNVGWGYRAINTLANLPAGGTTADIYLKFINTNPTALARTCMFMDFIVFKQSPAAASDYLELGITGLATNPPVKQATASTFGVAGATARPTHSISFTTGPNDTSLTYYVKKSGTNTLRGYIDELGLSEDSAYTPVYPPGSTYFNGFEDSWHPANWKWGLGTPLLDSTIKSEGNFSFKLDGSVDKNAVYRVLSSSYAKVATVDFYDDMAAGNKSLIAHVDSSGATNFDKIANMYGAGIHTANSATNYSTTLGTGAWQTSTVTRTLGWHKHTFDYSSGTGVDMYIDQVWVGYSNKAISFNTIALGDFFTGENSTGNFDNVNVVDTTTLKGPLDVTVPNNLTVGTASITDTSAAVTFSPLIRGGINPQVTLSVTNALGTNQPFTTGGSLPVGLSTMTVKVTDGATVITKTFFVNVIQTSFFENFENIKADTSVSPTKLGTWTQYNPNAIPDTTKVKSYDGYQSYASLGAFTSNNDGNINAIIKTGDFGGVYGKVVTAWLYDDSTAGTLNQVLNVKSSSTDASNKNSWYVGPYFKSPSAGSQTKYAVRAAQPVAAGGTNGAFAATTISRTTGWHQMKYDFTETGKVKIYIDNQFVRTETLTSLEPDVIAIGDFWQDALSKSLTSYWDNVAITTTNDTMGPVITPSANATTYFADTTGVAIDSAISFKDLDTAAIPDTAKVMVSIVDGFKGTEDVLQLTNAPSTMGDIAGSYDATTGILTLTSAGGATAAQWQAALQAVQYKNNLTTPSVGSRGVSIVGYDGINLGNAVTKTVSISLNKLPIVSNTTLTATVNTAVYFMATNFGFSDFDGDALVSVKILTLPTHGALKLSGTDVVADQVILASDFANITYSPTTDYVGTDVFTWNGFDGNRFANTGAEIHINVMEVPPNIYTIMATAGIGGAIMGDVTVTEGTYATFTFIPDSGYLIDTLIVDNASETVTGNTYTFANVTSNHTIHVTFKSVPNNESGGSIPPTPVPVPTPEGTVIIDPGQLTKSENGRTTVEIPANTTEIKLPGNTADLIQRNNLDIKSDALTLSIPSEVLKQLTRTLSADELKGGTISLKMSPLSIADAKELINKSSQSANTVNKLFGDVFEFNLSIQTADGKTINLSKFDKPIKLEFKISPSMNPKLAGIYYLANDGKLVYVGGKVNHGVITAEINHFSKYALLEVTKTFTDVPSGHWASNVIKELAAKQILTGTSATTFEPGRSVTRAEFTVLLVRALKLTEKGEMTFTDVKSGEWYADAVSIAVKAGIVQGKSATLFDANAQITREEMVTLLLRAYEFKKGKAVGTATHSFSDVDQVSLWAVEFVKTALSLNLIQGRSADKFDPQGITTRAEAAQVLYNLLVATQAIE